MNRKAGQAELDRHARRTDSSRGDRMLSLDECALRTGLKVSTWRSWILLRKIPYYKISRSVRILESDLERLIDESRIPAREDVHA